MAAHRPHEGGRCEALGQALAIKLREFGLKLFPTLLEDFVVGNVSDMLNRIRDLDTIAKSGDDAILRELNGTFEGC